MPFSRGKEGKEERTYRLNKAGAKIASYHKLALIINMKTWKVVKYGELHEMNKYIDKKYYHHPQYQHRNFDNMIYWSDVWRVEALEEMIDNQNTEFTGQLDYPDTDHLFVEDKSPGMVYHPFCISGTPSMEYWKEQEEKWKIAFEKSKNPDDEAAEKRRQRSLKAAETLRKKREAAKK